MTAKNKGILHERLGSYKKDHCWQYEIRVQNMKEDLESAGMTAKYANSLRTSDFEFVNVTDKKEQKKLKYFIERHEWLGTLSQFTTQWFACYHKGILAGVLLFNVPNAFSKLMGDDTKQMERLISRGACISWSPKNLGSCFLMWCLNWMAKNTQWRLFTAYSDPSAKELGTIYQACNFYYLGKKSGGAKKYFNPYTGKLVSDRYFRQKTVYRKLAGELGIKWDMNWQHPTGMLWDNMPDSIEVQLRAMSKQKQSESKFIILPNKHKYAYVLGSSKKETKQLRKLFLDRNKIFNYPKER